MYYLKIKEILGKTETGYNTTFGPFGCKSEPKTPEQLGLPAIEVKSIGGVTYKPRFAVSSKDGHLIIQFGHYFGGGTYAFDTILGRDEWSSPKGGGLNLYGGDKTGNSTINTSEMNKLTDWMEKHEDTLKQKLNANITANWKQKVEAKYGIVEKIKGFLKENMKKIIMGAMATVIAFNSANAQGKNLTDSHQKGGKAPTMEVKKDMPAPTKIQSQCDKLANDMTKLMDKNDLDVKVEIKCVKIGEGLGQVWKIAPAHENEGQSIFVKVMDTEGAKVLKASTSGTGGIQDGTYEAANQIVELMADHLKVDAVDVYKLGTPIGE